MYIKSSILVLLVATGAFALDTSSLVRWAQTYHLLRVGWVCCMFVAFRRLKGSLHHLH